MDQETKKIVLEKIKIGVLSAIGGAIVLAIIGFKLGGWVTSSTADEMAEEVAQKAVLDRIVPICIEKFKQDPEKDRKLKELKETDSWNRSDYVKKQGWATMPGEKEADRDFAEKCAEQIVQISK